MITCVLVAMCVAPLACDEAPAPAGPAPESQVAAPRVTGNPERGRALMARFECNRCHEGTGLPEVGEARHCVRCHQSIREGTFDAPPAALRRWQQNLRSLNDVPSLAGLEGHLRADWIAAFLMNPDDVRPGLPATMPRLPISEDDARDIAAAIAGNAALEGVTLPGAPGALSNSDGDAAARSAAAGLGLLQERGCLACHAFTGAIAAPPPPAPGPAQALAPDLAHTRYRMNRASVLSWLEDPAALRPGTLMPALPMSPADREALTDAILETRLDPQMLRTAPDRLPLLERPVRFDEVSERVLSKTCWHCHADADFAMGDAGAGNTGGFGYPARGVNLLDYAGASSGYLDEAGERRSLFTMEDGVPHLVRILMARHHEAVGQPVDGLTGMPLGLPPLPMEEIQLVESWIAQGRPN